MIFKSETTELLCTSNAGIGKSYALEREDIRQSMRERDFFSGDVSLQDKRVMKLIVLLQCVHQLFYVFAQPY